MSRRANKVDNSNFYDKAFLRIQECVKLTGEVRVLDVFHGSGRLWAFVSKVLNKKINVTGIEKERGKSCFTVLEGDNRKFIPILDLSKFTFIDIDAYGSVSTQFLQIIQNKSFNGCPIFITEISVSHGAIHNSILKHLNIKHLYSQNRTVFHSMYYDLIFEMFRMNGVKKIKYIRRNLCGSRKLYGVLYF